MTASLRLMLAVMLSVACAIAMAAEPRARDLGVPFEGTPGALNAITALVRIAP